MIYRWLIRFFAACRERRDLETQVAFLAGELRDVKSEAKVLFYMMRVYERALSETRRTVAGHSVQLQQLVQREDPGALDRWSRDRTAN